MIEYLNDPDEFPTVQEARQHARAIYEQVVNSNESPQVIERWRVVCTMIGVMLQPARMHGT